MPRSSAYRQCSHVAFAFQVECSPIAASTPARVPDEPRGVTYSVVQFETTTQPTAPSPPTRAPGRFRDHYLPLMLQLELDKHFNNTCTFPLCPFETEASRTPPLLFTPTSKSVLSRRKHEYSNRMIVGMKGASRGQKSSSTVEGNRHRRRKIVIDRRETTSTSKGRRLPRRIVVVVVTGTRGRSSVDTYLCQ